MCVCSRTYPARNAPCAILPSVACPALQYFSTLSHKRHDFREKVTEHKMCVLIFCTTFVWNISHSEKNLARYDQNVYRSACKVPLIFPDFKEIWIFSTDVSKNTQIRIKFYENPLSGSRVFPCEQTDGRDLVNISRNSTQCAVPVPGLSLRCDPQYRKLPRAIYCGHTSLDTASC